MTYRFLFRVIGEKIGSLHQYRQWLRDQARYKRKSGWIDDESL